jgi:hypothetical protein
MPSRFVSVNIHGVQRLGNVGVQVLLVHVTEPLRHPLSCAKDEQTSPSVAHGSDTKMRIRATEG